MFSAILRWLDKSDEQFLSKVQNPEQQKKYLKQLRYSRLHYTLLLCLSVALLTAAIFFSEKDISTSVLLFVMGIVGCLDVEGKIRLIRVINSFRFSKDTNEAKMG